MRRPGALLVGGAALALVLAASGGESSGWAGSGTAQIPPPAAGPQNAPAEAAASAGDVSDLPIEEVPVPSGVTVGRTLAVLLTGDGGWAKLVKALSAGIAKRGYPVAALNSLKYYWDAKTPEQSGTDLARLITHYLAAWKMDRLLLVGYSLGADVLPFMANRLDPALLDKVDLIALVSPDRTATFEFHMSDWFHMKSRAPEYPILPEVERLKGKPLVCIRGEEETDSLCTELPSDEGEAVTLAGGHHLGGNYDAIVEAILSRLKR